MIHDNFAALTAPLARPGMAAATRKPSRAKRSWPARLAPFDLWKMALQYAMGVKTEAIANEFGVSTGYVCIQARAHGLKMRGRAYPKAGNPEDVEHLRRWARRKATTIRNDAARAAIAWEVLAELE